MFTIEKMTNLDFSKIRSHKGSQHNGFEELVCQLARLHPPDNAQCFVRKEGSGGDAGVECFWALKDGSEHAWQAKYFLKTITDNQWRQISDSVKTALEKHPKLKKYYICLPLNRTDQRKDNKESQLEKWNKKIREWEEIARSKNMNVKFEFWGESEILDMLSTDDPLFSGRVLYWFNAPILQLQHLKNIAENSKQSLGDRFSSELNINLPIAKSFDGIGLTPNWYQRFYSVAENWLEALQKLRNIINEENSNLTEDRWSPIKEPASKLEFLLKQTIKINSLYENKERLLEITQSLKRNSKTKFNSEETKKVREIDWYFNQFDDVTYELYRFLSHKDMTAFSIKSMLLSGNAGVGKSHLLCDITLNRLKDNLPTLFLLGQHYDGGNPLKFISDSLDLNKREILGALDALGETHSTRTLIMIDAINEGLYKEDWKHHIINLIAELKEYPHIAFVFSCRSTYLQYLLPQIKNSGTNQNEAKLAVEIEHKGFSDPGHQAIYKYLEKQNFLVPSSPVMNPEFFNPLFLKIYCKALKSKGKSRFPTGSQGITKSFNFYIDAISETINGRKKYITGEQVVLKALLSFASQLFPNNLYGLPIDKARKIIKLSDPKQERGEELIDELLNEGVLSEDIYKNDPIIRFTYERFSDYFIAESLIEKEIIGKPKKLKKTINLIKYFILRILFEKNYALESENLKLYFKKGTPIGNIIFNNIYSLGGIIEALSVCLADRFKIELFDVIEIEKIKKQQLLETTFTRSLLWRSSDSFTKRTFDLLKQIPRQYFYSFALDILLRLSIEPKHPWNADLLHKILFNKTLAKRDKFWSIHVASCYQNEESFTIRNLIDWPYFSNTRNLESECARLYAITLIWLTTASYREVRDKATKSAIIILSEHPEHLLQLIDNFSEVNDLYVLERLYAIAYGVTVNIEDKNLVSKIAEKTYEKVFRTDKPIPHILLRDYARCILEYTYNQKLLSDEINPESFRPPYESDWPIENPMDSEIDALVDDKEYGSVHHSLTGFDGDFGIYTMNCVHSFSPTSLTKERPETKRELQRKFIDKLSDKQKALYYENLKKHNFIEKEQISALKEKFKSEFGKEFDEEYMDMIRVDRKHNQYDKYLTQYNSLKENHRKQSSKEKNKFMETLNEKQREHWRWLFSNRFMDDGTIAFSRKWTQRWVCKQVYKMGWKKELFEKFEKLMCSRGRAGGGPIERIGKKYQWIALHTLLAHLADNMHYIERYDEEKKYEGPWQLFKRDIDPSCLLRKTKSDITFGKNATQCWWQPHVPEFPEKDIKQQEEWFKSTTIVPLFKNLLQIKNPKDNSLWTVLHGSVNQQKELSPAKKEEGLYKPECWFRISAIIISKNDCNVLYEKLKNKDLRNPDIAEGGGIGRFLKEYPFYDAKYTNDWRKDLSGNDVHLKIKHLCPTMEYSWESGNTDHSIDESISFFLPSKTLIDKLHLHYLDCAPKVRQILLKV